MKDNDFNSFTINEIYEGMFNCVSNAYRHYFSAIEVAKLKYFGIANSLLILSAEESFKGILFFLKFCNYGRKFKVENTFKTHAKKHYKSRLIFDFWSAYNRIFDEIKNEIIENGKFKVEINEQLMEKLLSTKVDDIINDKTIDDKKKEAKWWKKANDKKNNGLYVDFENGKWLLPTEITEEEYLESKNMAMKMIFPLVEFIDSIEKIK